MGKNGSKKINRRTAVKALAGVAVVTGSAAIAARTSTHLTLSSPSGTVSGNVPFSVDFIGSYSRRRSPISGATIYLFDSSGSLATSVTDSSGNYSIPYTFESAGSFTCWTSDSSTGT